jgi:diguanylate cyclase (GGDEF)-like protein
MEKESLFSREEQVIREAEALLASPDIRDSRFARHYQALLLQYKKMFSQMQRIMRISDRFQGNLNITTHELEEQSNIDKLTGIANRRCFDMMYEKEWVRARREGATLGIIMVDVDHFKRYNDRYGHLQGDVCLSEIANAIRSSLQRPADSAARYGGEEFVVLLPNTDGPGAVTVAEGIARTVARLALEHRGSPVAPVVTVSQGVAAGSPGPTDDTSSLLRSADEALYKAKAEGRNRIVLFSR